jgi:hypothetical protein
MLFFLSGRDGRELKAVTDPNSARFFRIAAAGDMNGDGTPDYAVTIPSNSPSGPIRIEARSGADDSILWSDNRPFHEDFGSALLGRVDLDGDGRPDLVATGPRSTPGGVGAVFAYDHRGQPLWTVLGDAQRPIGWTQYWETLGRIGDFDGDGRDDVLAGGLDLGGGGGFVLSGRDGAELSRGTGGFGPIGESIAGAGDLDGDGTRDFVAGSCQSNTVVAFAGRSGAELYRWLRLSLFGHALEAGVDLDQDGIGDILVGAPREPELVGNRPGAVFAYSGRDGTQLFRLDTNRPAPGFETNFGWAVVALGTQPDSPFPVFAVSENRFEPGSTWLGRIQVFRGAPPGVRAFGEPCAGTLARAPRIGIRSVDGARTRIHLSAAEPRRSAVLSLGFSSTAWGPVALPLPLDQFGYPGCALAVAPELVCATTVAGNGYTSIDLPLPLALPGQGTVRVYGQWLALGGTRTAPGGWTAALSWEH